MVNVVFWALPTLFGYLFTSFYLKCIADPNVAICNRPDDNSFRITSMNNWISCMFNCCDTNPIANQILSDRYPAKVLPEIIIIIIIDFLSFLFSFIFNWILITWQLYRVRTWWLTAGMTVHVLYFFCFRHIDILTWYKDRPTGGVKRHGGDNNNEAFDSFNKDVDTPSLTLFLSLLNELASNIWSVFIYWLI